MANLDINILIAGLADQSIAVQKKLSIAEQARWTWVGRQPKRNQRLGFVQNDKVCNVLLRKILFLSRVQGATCCF